jgi:predicted amidohydrolase YtcJ
MNRAISWNRIGCRAPALVLAALLVGCAATGPSSPAAHQAADLVLVNGRIVTVDRYFSIKQAVAIKDGKFLAVGSNDEIRRFAAPNTRTIDLKGRTVLPGLFDSHTHVLRGGRTWDLEVNWVNVKSLAEGFKLIADRAAKVPPGTWIRVVGGWHDTQLVEKRMPTVAELDAVAPNHPVWMQRLYDRAILNTAGLKALGITADVQDPPRGKVLRDAGGKPIGVLGFFGILNWYLKLPQPTLEDEVRSMRNFFRELNRMGLTAIGDLAGGGQNWPDHYRGVEELHRRGELTLRVRWYMQPNRPGQEIEVIRQFIEKVKPGSGDDWLRPVGIGEQVTVGIFDGDAFVSNPPTFSPKALEEWKTIVRMIAESGWRFQAHATRDNSVRQLLPAIEELAKEIPSSKDRRLAFAHLEDVSVETMDRIKALGGGIAVQDRLIYHGQDVVKTLGRGFVRRAPPLKTMLHRGVPVGAGTDATRTAPYPPFWSIWWLVTGKTLDGVALRGPEENLSREEALRLYTAGSAWFSFDEDKLGSIEPGKLADLIVISADYLTVPVDRIKELESVLTIVGGKPVYAAGEFARLALR